MPALLFATIRLAVIFAIYREMLCFFSYTLCLHYAYRYFPNSESLSRSGTGRNAQLKDPYRFPNRPSLNETPTVPITFLVCAHYFLRRCDWADITRFHLLRRALTVIPPKAEVAM